MPDRNRYAAIIARVLESELPRSKAGTLAARIVAALDAAAEQTGAAYFERGDIVQLVRGPEAGALLVVGRSYTTGLDAFAPGREHGLSFPYAPFADFLHTGGRVSFLPASSAVHVQGQARTLNTGAAHGVR